MNSTNVKSNSLWHRQSWSPLRKEEAKELNHFKLIVIGNGDYKNCHHKVFKFEHFKLLGFEKIRLTKMKVVKFTFLKKNTYFKKKVIIFFTKVIFS
jgi:hypothetical protein